MSCFVHNFDWNMSGDILNNKASMFLSSDRDTVYQFPKFVVAISHRDLVHRDAAFLILENSKMFCKQDARRAYCISTQGKI